MKLHEVARRWQAKGVSVIPILANQTKKPAIRWAPYQATIPSLNEVDEWWGNGKPYGLAVICGEVSGNLEMTEIEGRANNVATMTAIQAEMDAAEIRHIWDMLNGPDGYSEMSPTGGLHYLYRIYGEPVPGNTKIAADENGLVLAETRGDGGYVIVAPTPGICHPSGESWVRINGDYGRVPVITWESRNRIHLALKRALDRSPEPPTVVAVPAMPMPLTSSTPGNDFEAATDWADILEPHGWRLHSRQGKERFWTRPGKDPRVGASATTGKAHDRDRLYVFSSSTIFDTERAYTKFGAYATLNHGGHYDEAARTLAARGFGERHSANVLDSFTIDGGESFQLYSRDEVGNAERLWDRLRGTVHHVHELKSYFRWTGSVWSEDWDGYVNRAMCGITTEMLHSDDESLQKFGNRSRSKRSLNASVDLMRSLQGCSKRWSDFNPHRNLLNVQNGVLNLLTGELYEHDPKYLMTRTFGAKLDRSATCPRFTEFMETTIPDPQLRSYLQRALGYTLLGDADHRAIFWIYGPPGTGKSTLMETIRCIFGDYGHTAPAGTFRQRNRNDTGPTNDLHSLQGKRFITGSETAESAAFDEDLLKRLSGRDQMVSRALYQDNVKWTAECTIWMATNNAPRFNTDDDAIWRRTKLIPFMNQFEGTPGEEPDYARRFLVPEADGILNWLLAGLTEFLAHGLGEPEEIQENAHEQRLQSDSVARFLDDRIVGGTLVEDPEQSIRTSALHSMYQEWTRASGERPLHNRRFFNRIKSMFPHLEYVKSGGYTYWRGLGHVPGAGVLGQIEPNRFS